MTQPASTAPSTADVRAWALENSEYEVGTRGRLPAEVIAEYNEAHPDAQHTPKA